MQINIPDNNTPSLTNKHILITGAGYGIGRTIALAYARQGAHVLLLGRTQEALNDTYDLIAQENLPQAAVIPFDLEQQQEQPYKQLAELIEGEFHKLDGVLHNAAILGQKTPLESYQAEVWHKVMQVNASAGFLLTKQLLPLLRKAPAARILFTTSSVGHQGRAYWGAYSASKFAVEGLMQIWADELENTSNIRVNAINPGATRTSMRADAYPAENPNSVKHASELIPLYVYLMSQASQSIHGQVLDP